MSGLLFFSLMFWLSSVSSVGVGESGEDLHVMLPGIWKGVHVEGQNPPAFVQVEYHFRKEKGVFVGEIALFVHDRVEVAPLSELSVRSTWRTEITFTAATLREKRFSGKLFLDPDEERLEGWGRDLATERSFGIVLNQRVAPDSK